MRFRNFSTEQARWLRLLATARKLQCERTGDYTFRVTSSAFRYNKTWYVVDLLEQICSCPAFTICTHLVLAEDSQLHDADFSAWHDRYIEDFRQREKALLSGEMPTKVVKTLKQIYEAA